MMKPMTKISMSLVSNLNRSTIFLPMANDTKRLENINAMLKSRPKINATGKPIMVTASNDCILANNRGRMDANIITLFNSVF
ncbi:MAG: hypothetical protein C5S38_02605 [Candidatus Methanophagaceae archaeon]|nr:MAG: hypothetical protein C5S38_02605 [Methanophagales archaeon]